MAVKITPEKVTEINELYLKLKTYAAVAREMGISAGTVKKYVVPNYQPFSHENDKKFTLDMLPSINVERFRGVDNYGSLCIMTVEEKYGIEELWKEIH